MLRCCLLFFAAGILSAAGLEVTSIRLSDSEDGVPLTSTSAFRAGEFVYLNFRVQGFALEGEEDPKIHLEYKINTTDPANRQIGTPETGKVESIIFPEDKKWMPKIRYHVQVPPSPQSGTYTMHVHVRDVNADQSIDVPVAFQVRAGQGTSDSLSISNFNWFRDDRGVNPLTAQSSYRPGNTAWGRFEISGYRFGDNNRHEVHFGISLKDSEGKVLFEKPQAAVDKGQGAYPKMYTSAAFNIHLDRKLAAGEYLLTIRVQDAVGDQQTEATQVLRVNP